MNVDCEIYKQKLIEKFRKENFFEELGINKEIFEKEIDVYIKQNFEKHGIPEFTEEEIVSFLEICRKKTINMDVDDSIRKLIDCGFVETVILEDGQLGYKPTEKGRNYINSTTKFN